MGLEELWYEPLCYHGAFETELLPASYVYAYSNTICHNRPHSNAYSPHSFSYQNDYLHAIDNAYSNIHPD
jgi:hypothetical protein